MEVIAWREGLRRRALEVARQVAQLVDGAVLLVGSYARGDFSEDSDVDILVIGRFSEPPHKRLLDLKTPPNVELIALNVEEGLAVVSKCYPLAFDIALGIVLKDDMNISEELVKRARACLKRG